jgi:hypothetical protein
MAYPFRNPITPEQINGTKSVSRSEVFGTNFSVLGIGGYMEVYNLSDLLFIIPSGSTGTIEYTGNSIPINFVKGTGSGYSPDVLVLGSDNLSSGRRRLGMLAYVYETDQIYQYRIDNYNTLWATATGATGVGGDTVVISEFGTTIKNNSVAGQNFINAWTANTIEDVSGETSSTAVWKKLSTGGGSGGTTDFSAVSINSITQFTSSSNKTINFSGINLTITSAATNTLVFSAGTGGSGGGTTVTGGTYSAGTLTLDNSTGGTVSVTGFPATTSFGVTVDGSGGVITTGQKGYVRIPYGFTITSWTLIGSPSGSITFDIWRTNGAIPTVANTIIGGGGTKPNLSSGTYATSSTLTNWTITGATGDVIGWNVDSCTTTTIATLQLFVTRTQ